MRGDCASEDLRLVGDVGHAAEILRQQARRRPDRTVTSRSNAPSRLAASSAKAFRGTRSPRNNTGVGRWIPKPFSALEKKTASPSSRTSSSALVDDAPPGQIHPEKDIVADKRVIRSCDLPKTAKRALEDAKSGEASFLISTRAKWSGSGWRRTIPRSRKPCSAAVPSVFPAEARLRRQPSRFRRRKTSSAARSQLRVCAWRGEFAPIPA